MKLLYCQDCGDIVAPLPNNNRPRWCLCRRHAVWWVNSAAGVLRLYDEDSAAAMALTERSYPNQPRAYVIGLTNALLGYDGEALNAAIVQKLVDLHEDYYIFKRWRSLVIRIRPGESDDTAWATKLPT